MAININRVYTRGGDGGQTSLVGGARVGKDCRKLESYGTVDELNCLVGSARTIIAGSKAARGGLPTSVRTELEIGLRRVQNKLFDAGSILATPEGSSYPGMPTLTDEDATGLEREMDAMQKSLEPLKSFVLPGGTLPNAALHECRAVCRRAEREILRLSREERLDARVIKYVNRLSDYFFVMARYAARKAGVGEYLWEYGPPAAKAAENGASQAKVKGAKGSWSARKTAGMAVKPARKAANPARKAAKPTR